MVVADTSPLNYLILLGNADILHKIYGRVVVPAAVLVEMQHQDAPAEVRAWTAALPEWLEQIPVTQFDPTLGNRLGAGEREAISLAMELQADLLLIDELAGRQEAKARQINVAGTLAVLLQASLRGYLNFPEELDRLHGLNFRASPSIEAELLARYNRSRKQS